MKVKQKVDVFKPVVIILENKEEFNNIVNELSQLPHGNIELDSLYVKLLGIEDTGDW